MIASMTGFSRYETTSKECTVVIEIRSLNNRFLDIFVKLPRKFTEFEDDIKNLVRKEISRGKIDVSIIIKGFEDAGNEMSVNMPLAKKYFNMFKSLEKSFGVPVTVKPEDLMKIDDLIQFNTSPKRREWLRKLILRSMVVALKDLKKHKYEEGKNLSDDFLKRLNMISDSLKSILKKFKSRHVEDFKHLRSRIARVLKDFDKLDKQRMEIEAAYIAEKSDISEECVRIDSHLKMFKNSLRSKGAVGRRLDFILQEINREANTISSKSNNVLISQEVVRIKEELDRLKEQVRNIE